MVSCPPLLSSPPSFSSCPPASLSSAKKKVDDNYIADSRRYRQCLRTRSYHLRVSTASLQSSLIFKASYISIYVLWGRRGTEEEQEEEEEGDVCLLFIFRVIFRDWFTYFSLQLHTHSLTARLRGMNVEGKESSVRVIGNEGQNQIK